MKRETSQRRGLIVLADGAQAAFAAGAVGALARAGTRWTTGRGAGLGAQIAVLALLDEADEAERRWRRQAELGVPLLTSVVASSRQRLGAIPGVTASADAWTLEGWLDPSVLGEHLAPERAAIPERLASAAVTCEVAIEDLTAGEAHWIDLRRLGASDAERTLRTAACFPAGWGSIEDGRDPQPHRLWGGVGVITALEPLLGNEADVWDVVCGFPVPPVARVGLGTSLLELVQRRAEAAAARIVETSVGSATGRGDLIAPREDVYRECCGRADAELGVEYPLPWERNGELIAQLIGLGGASAERNISASGS